MAGGTACSVGMTSPLTAAPRAGRPGNWLRPLPEHLANLIVPSTGNVPGGGLVLVESGAGSGTTYTIFLPAKIMAEDAA